MNTTTTRIDPEQISEPKVLPESTIQYLDSDYHESPTDIADRCTLATGSYIVIICHIYIKDQFLFLWLKIGDFLMIRWFSIENGSDINLVRNTFDHFSLQIVGT